MQKTITISGMHCQHCVQAVQDALKEVARVTAVQVNLDAQNAVVEGNDLNNAALQEAIEDIGFDVEKID